ncbi:MAG: hypothetical protein IJ532_00225 [Alphaproteobacteria bacterium]|nr:hypothetical protein [Alphaproteobacteria bacterium]
MMRKKETSGLLLPLKLLSLTTGGSVSSVKIRQEVMPLMRRNIEAVKFIPPEEVPLIREYAEKVKVFAPELAKELNSLVAKFNPNL